MTTDSDRHSDTITIKVPSDIEPERIDKYLGNHPDLKISRTRAQKLITDDLVLVDGEPVSGKHRLGGGETIRLTVPPEPKCEIVGEDISLDIVYEDEYLAVVNKPAGMVTHPAAGNYRGTMVNALVHHFGKLSQLGGSDRPGIVHRLDKDTSGLLVVARDDQTYNTLQQAIQTRRLIRTYLALVCGHLKSDSGTIDLPIGRSVKDRKHMTVTGLKSREAMTKYKLIERYRSYDLLEVSLLTGRTHQIRVHFSHIGHPVFGDPEYGGREKWHRGVFGPERPLAKQLLDLISRQALHAKKLEFEHPVTGETKVFESALPGDFKAVLDLLNREGR